MQVIAQQEFGGPEVLTRTERPVPDPLPTEVRVRVMAAGINPVDWKTRAGGGIAGVLGAPPFVLGWDVAGVVDAVGFGVTTLHEGDLVLGMPWFPREAGGYGEYVAAPSRHFVRVPDGMTVAEAAGLPLAFLTAWQALVDTADLRPGQRVLVHAAAGGVGHLAVQIAKARGAHVIGTASAGKQGLLRELGVDEPVDYTAAPFEEVVGDVDIALDLVGGDTSVRSVAVTRPGGLVICVPAGLPPELADAAGAAGVRATGILVEPDHAGLQAAVDLYRAGNLSVRVERTFPLADAALAHALGERGHTSGKLVLTVSS
ncbi:MAG: NADP-dependent oxidoreductase [Actinobacteria bacterium]|nr:NADP-dependent oxidoreductase [Actinomycetota bacterium]